MDPSRYKQLKTQRGFNYSYYWSPPAPGKPVLFFSHGFPAGSFSWRKQVPFFEPLGYGLLVPDFLGYGDTDKPTDPTVYIGSGHAQDVVDILDAEGINQRVSACTFFSGSYAPPVPPGANRISTGGDIKQKFGYDIFAYMRFFVQPDAPTVIEKNLDSFISLLYPEKIQLWKDHLCYMTQEESEHLKTALRKGGISAPLCWYRAMAETTTSEDDATTSLRRLTSDCIWLPIMGDTVHAKYVKGEVTRKEITGDHWGVESHAEELSVILLEWLRGLDS
ncbi:alpha/beta-hydrolase [Mycena olivaceomarginata]|nr:alpha/beta-hydrolase [Mycena olivaceomarginata]